MGNLIVAAKMLDGRGRCCGRKPIIYRRPHHLFCPRCDAAFDPADHRQVANWAYFKLDDNRFEARTTRATPPTKCGDGA